MDTTANGVFLAQQGHRQAAASQPKVHVSAYILEDIMLWIACVRKPDVPHQIIHHCIAVSHYYVVVLMTPLV